MTINNEEAIIISINPRWVEKILSGEKITEIRKTIPKCSLPIKVYIYCTQGQELWGDGTGETWYGIAEDEDIDLVYELSPDLARLNGKIVGEFTLKQYNKFNIEGLKWYNVQDVILQHSCLKECELKKYIGDKIGYAWHIDNLKIYRKPQSINEIGVKKAPQSWCYCKTLKIV